MAISALRRLSIPLLVIAVTIALLALSSESSKAHHGWTGAPEFDPIFTANLCNGLPTDFSGPAPLPGPNAPPGGCTAGGAATGSNPDLTFDFLIPAGHHAYSEDYFVTTVDAAFTLASDSDIPGPNSDNDTGAISGGLKSKITLGLLNGACNSTALEPSFIWWEAEADDNLTDEVVVAVSGTADRWASVIADDIPDFLPGGADDFAQQADADSPVVEKYPSFLNTFFDPDGDGLDGGTVGTRPAVPHSRAAGATIIGGDWQLLQQIVFAPGVLQETYSANPNTKTHPFAKLDKSVGWTTVIMLNDPASPVFSVSSINDFCTELGTNGMVLGMADTDHDGVGDTAQVTAPSAAGAYHASERTQGQRDADGDGIDNDMDTCPYTPNLQDPFTSTGPENDHFDEACDPSPGVDTQGAPANQPGDHDGDYYSNAQDLCPAVQHIAPDQLPPNDGGTGEADNERIIGNTAGAPDGGPLGDFIGDGCDTDDILSDGDFFNVIYTDSFCIGLTDGDEDGWCAGSGLGTDIDDAVFDDTGGSESRQMSDDEPAIPVVLPDTDGDGTVDFAEWSIGTDPDNACSLITGHDAWKQDFNQDRFINLVDLNKLLPPPLGSWGSSPGSACDCYVVRRDINPPSAGNEWGPDGFINLVDLNQMLPAPLGQWGAGCSGPAGQ